MIRILSDLHVYDAQTLVRELSQLEPLLIGVQTLVINGDACETRHGLAADRVGELCEFFRQRVREVIFITGNHDPDISAIHELSLADGRVWLTHGDACFDDLTPWSHLQPVIVRQVAELLAAEPGAEWTDLAVRLRIARTVARTLSENVDPAACDWRAQVHRFWHTFFPPRQVIAMVKAWRELPDYASVLARRERPRAQVVITGHVHFPRVWLRERGPAVINTGSFFRPLGGLIVDVLVDHIEVRKVKRRGECFIPGRRVAQLPLRPAQILTNFD